LSDRLQGTQGQRALGIRAGTQPPPGLEAAVELISRMMDGSISYDPGRHVEPVTSGPGAKQEDKIERLKEVPIFESCSEKQFRSVARIARIFDVAANTVLARAGEPGDEFFLIIDGSARVDVSPKKHVLLRPGEFFGEMSILDGGPRSATVVAETPVRLLIISRRHFAALLKDVPGLTETLLVTLSKRVRQAEKRAERRGAASAGL
jgi:CRP/FNR family transcriptional regulator, cyclic AMP receptor protein